MFFDRIHSIVAVLATLAFTAMLSLPCLCATASAQMEAGESGCCPQDEEDQEHNDCNCGCAEASPADETSEVLPSSGAIVVSFDEDSLDASTTWWSPDLVVALWLVNRLAEFEDIHSPVEPDPLLLKTDRSDTYLKNSTFLI